MNSHPYFIQRFGTDHGRQLLAQADQVRRIKDATPTRAKRVGRLGILHRRPTTTVRPATTG